jgi:hypothetical protein
MQAIMVALHELMERISAWYKAYRKDQESAAASMDVRRMYVVSTNAADITRVLDEQFKLFNTQDLDGQLASRLGTRKEGAEDWYEVHMERMRSHDSSMKKQINARAAVVKLLHHQDQFAQLSTFISEAAALQNQLVGMINANAESRAVALLESDAFTRIPELHRRVAAVADGHARAHRALPARRRCQAGGQAVSDPGQDPQQRRRPRRHAGAHVAGRRTGPRSTLLPRSTTATA